MNRNLRGTLLFVIVLTGSAVLAQEAGKSLLLVLIKPQSKMVIVDTAAKKVVGEVPTGTGPHEVTVSADGKLAFVSNYGDRTPGQSLSVIDLSARKELRRVDLGALRRPHGIVQAAGKVYFTAEVNKVVVRYDPAGDRLDWLMGTGQDTSHMIVINHDQSKIFTANIQSDSLTVLEPRGQTGAWHATAIPVGKGPEAIDLSPDEKEIWTAHSQDGGISIVDTAAEKVVATIPALTKHSNRLKFTPDGNLVLVSDPESNQVLVIEAKTRKLRQRISTPAQPLGIQMTPDGKRAYVACSGAGQVAVIDLGTLALEGTIDVGPGPDGMAWVQ